MDIKVRGEKERKKLPEKNPYCIKQKIHEFKGMPNLKEKNIFATDIVSVQLINYNVYMW